MSGGHSPAWLGHATQVSIAAGLVGVYRTREEAERIAARFLKAGGVASSVHHFLPDNFAAIQVGAEERNVPLVQAQIDAAIAKASEAA